VFGDVEFGGADDVIANWEQIKQEEKKGRGLFDGLPVYLPALQTAGRMGAKASRLGFDWPDTEGVRAKVDEELLEIEEAVTSGDKTAVSDEIGDLLFAVAQWARHLGVEPEEALRGSCNRFKSRFSKMEEMALNQNSKLGEMNIDEMETLWQQAKRETA
jgi:MazG family protein